MYVEVAVKSRYLWFPGRGGLSPHREGGYIVCSMVYVPEKHTGAARTFYTFPIGAIIHCQIKRAMRPMSKSSSYKTPSFLTKRLNLLKFRPVGDFSGEKLQTREPGTFSS